MLYKGNEKLVSRTKLKVVHVISYINIELILFSQMKQNLGVSLDNTFSPLPSEFIPPLFYFAPWLFEVKISIYCVPSNIFWKKEIL